MDADESGKNTQDTPSAKAATQNNAKKHTHTDMHSYSRRLTLVMISPLFLLPKNNSVDRKRRNNFATDNEHWRILRSRTAIDNENCDENYDRQ